MKIELKPFSKQLSESELLVIFRFEGGEFYPTLDAAGLAKAPALKQAIAAKDIKGKPGAMSLLYLGEDSPTKRLLVIGVGKREKFRVEGLISAVSAAVWKAEKLGVSELTCYPLPLKDEGEAVKQTALAALLANYRFDRYLPKLAKKPRPSTLRILVGKATSALKTVVEQAAIVAKYQNFSRELINEPVNVMTPLEFASRVSKEAEEIGLQCEVHDEEWIHKKGMKLLWGVAKGSEEPPRLVVLRHNGGGKNAPWLGIVGKGVMFDTGGLSLKNTAGMLSMKADMGGGAATVGALLAAAALSVKKNIIGIVPAVINAIDGRAQNVSDIVQSFDGPSVEIVNTDAEGRLVLADGLSYARELGAETLIDICTLTGASVVALGMKVAALFTDDDNLRDIVLTGKETTAEVFWQLPLFDHYAEALKSTYAETKNSGGRWGGASTAAKFLEKFTDGKPWAHLDIAGKELLDKPWLCYRKGATAFGVRTLLHLIENR
ncbi:leucyl aminopeptidase [bacterium]|nr:leucyl aminopeptidase [bacterium]